MNIRGICEQLRAQMENGNVDPSLVEKLLDAWDSLLTGELCYIEHTSDLHAKLVLRYDSDIFEVRPIE